MHVRKCFNLQITEMDRLLWKILLLRKQLPFILRIYSRTTLFAMFDLDVSGFKRIFRVIHLNGGFPNG